MTDKMYKEYKILKGSEIRGSQLRLPRAITIHKAALLHPCVTVNSCIRNSADAEIIILTLHRLSIPDEPVYPIQEVEEIAVICTKEDLSLPEVYALRKDFPVGLPHSNARALNILYPYVSVMSLFQTSDTSSMLMIISIIS